MTRCQLNLTLTATKLLLQHQSASENRRDTYQIPVKPKEPRALFLSEWWCGSARGDARGMLLSLQLRIFPAQLARGALQHINRGQGQCACVSMLERVANDPGGEAIASAWSPQEPRVHRCRFRSHRARSTIQNAGPESR